MKTVLSFINHIPHIPFSFIVKILLTAVLIFFMSGVYALQDADDVPLSKIEKDLQKNTRIEKLESCSARQLMQFIGIDASDYDSFIYYKSKKALGVEEVLIVKANPGSSLDAVRDAVESRVSTQISVYKDYGPDQVALLKNAIITQRGDYLFYCVENNPESYEEVFDHAV